MCVYIYIYIYTHIFVMCMWRNNTTMLHDKYTDAFDYLYAMVERCVC